MRTHRLLALSSVIFLGFSGAARGVGIFEYALPAANDGPTGIAVGADGALWFTAEGTNKVGRITTTGTIAEYAIPTTNSAPVGITAGALLVVGMAYSAMVPVVVIRPTTN